MRMTIGRNKRRFGMVLGAMMALPTGLAAQQDTTRTDTLPRYTLEEVTVTVTRAEAERTSLPRKVDVITTADLERTPANELTDVLKKLAAVDVIQFPGLLSGVGIRGFRPQFSGINQRTLILIDRRPAGITNLSLIDPSGIQRIEVLKGPASALYGSNAMGGVVNIITRSSRGGIRTSLSAGYGSFDTYEGSLTAGGNLTDALDFDLGFSVFDRGGDYRVGKGNLFRDWLGDGTAVRTLDDGTTAADPDTVGGEVRPFSEYGSYSGTLRLGYQLDERWRVDARGHRFAANGVQNPGDLFSPFPSQSLKNVARSGGELSLSGSLEGHEISATLFTAAEDAEYFNVPEATAEQPRFISFRTPARWRGLQLQDVARIGTHTITAGVDYTSADAESQRFTEPGVRGAPFGPNSGIDSRAAFAEGRFAFLDERLVGTIGGRLDNIVFGVEETELFDGLAAANTERYTAFNPSIGLQGRVGSGIRVHGTAGRAFVAPDAFVVAGYAEHELFGSPGNATIARGNPALEPENSFTWDAGIGISRPERGFDVDVTYFHTDVEDRITSRFTVPDTPTFTSTGDTVGSIITYVNADEAEIRGVEWRLDYDLGTLLRGGYALRLFTNATHILRAEEITGGAARDIRNVADLTLNYGIEYDDLRRFSTRLSGRYVGERMDDDFSDFTNPAPVRYPAFMTLDLVTGVRLTDRYQVSLLVSNLTDENYYEVRGYPLPGRALQVRVTAEF